MFHLVYMSNASHCFTGDELSELLKLSRRNNAKYNITGLLLYINGHFIQLIEGERKFVEATYSRIVTDQRHSSVTLLDRRDINRRSFPNSSMGFKSITYAEASKLLQSLPIEHYDDLLQFAKNSPQTVLGLMFNYKASVAS